MDESKKARQYQRIYDQLKELLTKTDDREARMATVCALLHHKMEPFFWTGFYLLKNGQLTVSCYQGPLACQVLEQNKGVCWAAINQQQTLVVPDVHAFPGHIACDGRSRSEIVIPLKDASGTITGVLDVDSQELNSFDGIDAEYLERIVSLIVPSLS